MFFFSLKYNFPHYFDRPSSCWCYSLGHALRHPVLPILVCFHTSFNPASYGVAHGVFCWCDNVACCCCRLWSSSSFGAWVLHRFHCLSQDPEIAIIRDTNETPHVWHPNWRGDETEGNHQAQRGKMAAAVGVVMAWCHFSSSRALHFPLQATHCWHRYYKQYTSW